MRCVPDYLFTFHAYGTWMPDRSEGSVHWKRGYQPQNIGLAEAYRSKQRERSARFDEGAQRLIIEALLETAHVKQVTIHAVGTDDTHIHIVCEWRDDARSAEQLQNRLKHAVTLRLNERLGRRTWFSKGGHRKAIRDIRHFDYLCDEYLPTHRGLRWDWRRGWC